MMSLKRSALALGAAAVMTASLAACGSSGASGSPKDASKADFCSALTGVTTSISGGNDESSFTSLQDAVKKLKDVGTPSDITADARAGYQIAVDAILKASWNDVKGNLGKSTFPGVSGDDVTKAQTFGTWAGKECAS